MRSNAAGLLTVVALFAIVNCDKLFANEPFAYEPVTSLASIGNPCGCAEDGCDICCDYDCCERCGFFPNTWISAAVTFDHFGSDFGFGAFRREGIGFQTHITRLAELDQPWVLQGMTDFTFSMESNDQILMNTTIGAAKLYYLDDAVGPIFDGPLYRRVAAGFAVDFFNNAPGGQPSMGWRGFASVGVCPLVDVGLFVGGPIQNQTGLNIQKYGYGYASLKLTERHTVFPFLGAVRGDFGSGTRMLAGLGASGANRFGRTLLWMGGDQNQFGIMVGFQLDVSAKGLLNCVGGGRTTLTGNGPFLANPGWLTDILLPAFG